MTTESTPARDLVSFQQAARACLIRVAGGPAMSHNPIERLEPMIRDAGFTIRTSGDLRPFPRYVAATRPGD